MAFIFFLLFMFIFYIYYPANKPLEEKKKKQVEEKNPDKERIKRRYEKLKKRNMDAWVKHNQ